MSDKKPKQIAIYGKGGIGKSTTTSNISAALADAGYKVMQFGCDPKADSTNTLRGGEYIPSVLDLLSEKRRVDAHEAIFHGFRGIYCVEAGGPAPGVGCAGRGIITAVELLKQQRIFEELDLDIVIYDVLGDVVCGGFAVPIREGIAEHVFTVSSADFMAIYAANNLFKGIEKYSNTGGALLGGDHRQLHEHRFPSRDHRRLRRPHEDADRAVRAPLAHGHPGRTAGQDDDRGGAELGPGRGLSCARQKHRRAHQLEGADRPQRPRAARVVVSVGGPADRDRACRRARPRGGLKTPGR